MAPAAGEAQHTKSIRYTKLAEELETIAHGGLVWCEEQTRKRLLEAVKAALPELERQDDAVQRILYTVSSCADNL